MVNLGDRNAAFQAAKPSGMQVVDLVLPANGMARHGLLDDDLDSDGPGDGLIDSDEESFRAMANDNLHRH